MTAKTVLTHAACAAGGAIVAAILAHLYYAPARSETVGAASWNYPAGCRALVQRVVDGDTIVLADGMHVRYLGINAPETGRFVRDPAPLAKEAAGRNDALVGGKTVRLVPGPAPMDAYGRLLADVYVTDGAGKEIFVQEALVAEGLARAEGGPSPMPAESRERLAKAETAAKTAKAGIWGISEAQLPPESEFPYCGGSGEVYHRRSCPHALRTAPMNLRFYRTTEEAAATGRRPCGTCIGRGR
ncbi:MAG: thermonuclease family protein [Planctomycetota bacterium]|nr:thermonuclease family protein [Planctomycetota bacterium]